MNKYSTKPLPSDILLKTAKKIVVLRKNYKWTQKELADRSGVSYGSIKRFETTGQISFLSLLKIAEVLNRLEEFQGLFIDSNNDEIKKIFED